MQYFAPNAVVRLECTARISVNFYAFIKTHLLCLLTKLTLSGGDIDGQEHSTINLRTVSSHTDFHYSICCVEGPLQTKPEF